MSRIGAVPVRVVSEGVLDVEGDAILAVAYHITFHVKPSNEGEGKDGQNLQRIKVDIEKV